MEEGGGSWKKLVECAAATAFRPLGWPGACGQRSNGMTKARAALFFRCWSTMLLHVAVICY